ncbi:divalent-cation tolerance protein CutA [bacterium]|nr:divalent-cation tolerance protein CutA [bacterium]
MKDDPEEVVVAITTYPLQPFKRGTEYEWIQSLLDLGVAACISTLNVSSAYLWKGKRENKSEQMFLIKTTRGRIEDLKEALEEGHPYDTPELLVFPVIDGLDTYLDWIRSQTKTRDS